MKKLISLLIVIFNLNIAFFVDSLTPIKASYSRDSTNEKKDVKIAVNHTLQQRLQPPSFIDVINGIELDDDSPLKLMELDEENNQGSTDGVPGKQMRILAETRGFSKLERAKNTFTELSELANELPNIVSSKDLRTISSTINKHRDNPEKLQEIIESMKKKIFNLLEIAGKSKKIEQKIYSRNAVRDKAESQATTNVDNDEADRHRDLIQQEKQFMKSWHTQIALSQAADAKREPFKPEKNGDDKRSSVREILDSESEFKLKDDNSREVTEADVRAARQSVKRALYVKPEDLEPPSVLSVDESGEQLAHLHAWSDKRNEEARGVRKRQKSISGLRQTVNNTDELKKLINLAKAVYTSFIADESIAIRRELIKRMKIALNASSRNPAQLKKLIIIMLDKMDPDPPIKLDEDIAVFKETLKDTRNAEGLVDLAERVYASLVGDERINIPEDQLKRIGPAIKVSKDSPDALNKLIIGLLSMLDPALSAGAGNKTTSKNKKEVIHPAAKATSEMLTNSLEMKGRIKNFRSKWTLTKDLSDKTKASPKGFILQLRDMAQSLIDDKASEFVLAAFAHIEILDIVRIESLSGTFADYIVTAFSGTGADKFLDLTPIEPDQERKSGDKRITAGMDLKVMVLEPKKFTSIKAAKTIQSSN